MRTGVPRRDTDWVKTHSVWLSRLLLAPNAHHSERTSKQRDGSNRQAGIDLGSGVAGLVECHAMSRGAHTQRKTQHHKRVFHEILILHAQILSGGCAQDMKSMKIWGVKLIGMAVVHSPSAIQIQCLMVNVLNTALRHGTAP